MKKHLNLVFGIIKQLYLNNKISFIMFMVVQIIVSFAYIFFYTTAPQNRAQYISAKGYVRTISLDFNEEELGDSSYEDFLNVINNNNISEIEDITFHFADNQNNIYVSYLKTNNHSGDITGKSISQDNINNSDPVIIAALMANLYPDTKPKQLSIGDAISIDNIEFVVIGTRYVSNYDEIPYSIGLDKFKLVNTEVLFPTGITDKQKESLKDYFENSFSNVAVTLPATAAQETYEKMFLLILCSIFTGIISVVTFTFIFKYLIDKTKKIYIVNRICGASNKYNIELIIEIFVGLFSIAYICAIILFQISNMIIHIDIMDNVALKIRDGIIIYFIFILLIFIMIIPYAFFFIKKTIKEGEK
jgi:hypothetical protein